MRQLDQNVPARDPEPGGPVPIAMPLGAALIVAAHRSKPSPYSARLARLGRELRGEVGKPLVAWQRPIR